MLRPTVSMAAVKVVAPPPATPATVISAATASSSAPPPEIGDASIAAKYRRLEHREHVLQRPGMYIGSTESQPETLWLYNTVLKKMEKRQVQYNQGLYKIFDEILVNAADHWTRTEMAISQWRKQYGGRSKTARATAETPPEPTPVRVISVEIDVEQNRISVMNDGPGIPCVIHPTEKVYIPTMIFATLLTGSNYDDDGKTDDERIVGGQNGLGGKLANIYSTRFEIETVDALRQIHFHQVVENNMSLTHPPKVTNGYRGASFTRITFYPDLSRFKMRSIAATLELPPEPSLASPRTLRLDDDIVALMTKRVYDVAGWVEGRVQVSLNGAKIAFSSFQEYVNLYLPEGVTTPCFYQKINERWSMAVALSPNGHFEQISMVNGCNTIRGGKHVEYLVNQITRKMLAQVETQKATRAAAAAAKKGVGTRRVAAARPTGTSSALKPQHIKDNLWIFVKATVVNPEFDTQTKEALTLSMTKFGSRAELDDSAVTAIAKLGVLERARELARFREQQESISKMDQDGRRGRLNIPKLDDAEYAGHPRYALECVLIVTEGDSAKPFALAGVGSLDAESKKRWGIFPLKGKLLNVRDATSKQIINNEELMHLMQILGLQRGRDYRTDRTGLRYGGLMILTDADHDGSHIRGLLINFLHFFWRSLLERNDYIKAMMTPIVRAWPPRSSGHTEASLNFWSQAEYRAWKESFANPADLKGWAIKYYKGLGTSSDEDAKYIFNMMRVVNYRWQIHVKTPQVTYSPGGKMHLLTGDDATAQLLLTVNSIPATDAPAIDASAADTPTASDTATNPRADSITASPIAEPSSPLMTTPSESLNTPHRDVKIAPPTNLTIKPEVRAGMHNDLLLARLNPNDNAITLAFSRERADDRKEWLETHDPDALQVFNSEQSYQNFINDELRQFSMADCIRSIPSLCDGLKPGQRKIIYYLFKARVKKEMKVAVMCGYVIGKTAYHHGDKSLHDTVVCLARNYVGTNNLNLLIPAGAFGTRNMNGHDAASARYIGTGRNPILDLLFPIADHDLLTYLEDDGLTVEPEWYIPIIPMVLVNGAEGIGTGYSTAIPQYNPRDVIANLRQWIAGQPLTPLTPWYRGFLGTITPDPRSSKRFIMRGVWRMARDRKTNAIVPDCIEILEIPISTSYQSYQEYCENLLIKDGSTTATENAIQRQLREFKALIKNITYDKGTTYLRVTVTFVPHGLNTLLLHNTVEKAFKLEDTLSTNNMHLFNHCGKIQRYETPEEILEEYAEVRLAFYEQRRERLIHSIQEDMAKASARWRFVNDVIEGRITVQRRRRDAIIEQLTAAAYPTFSNVRPVKLSGGEATLEEEEEDDGTAITTTATPPAPLRGDYNYLLRMPIDSMTTETLARLQQEIADHQVRLNEVKTTSARQFWCNDLDALERALTQFENEWNRRFPDVVALQREISRLTPDDKISRRTTPPASVVLPPPTITSALMTTPPSERAKIPRVTIPITGKK